MSDIYIYIYVIYMTKPQILFWFLECMAAMGNTKLGRSAIPLLYVAMSLPLHWVYLSPHILRVVLQRLQKSRIQTSWKHVK